MTSRQFVTWHTLQCEFGTGSWAVVDGILTVSTAHGSKSAALLGNNTGEVLARLLMWEMQNELQHTMESPNAATDTSARLT